MELLLKNISSSDILQRKVFQQVKAKMNSIKNSNSDNWSSLSSAEKKLELFRRQKELLDTFLSTGAISQAQHDKSLKCLIEKMGIDKSEHGGVL